VTIIAGVNLLGRGILVGSDTRLTWKEGDSHAKSEVRQKLYCMDGTLVAGLGLFDFAEQVMKRLATEVSPSPRRAFDVTVEEYVRLRQIDHGDDTELWLTGLDQTFLLVACASPALELAVITNKLAGPVSFDAVVLDGRNSSTPASLHAQADHLHSLASQNLSFSALVEQEAAAMRNFVFQSADEDPFVSRTCQFAIVMVDGETSLSRMLSPDEPLTPVITQMLASVTT
jgi:hypothetical protein